MKRLERKMSGKPIEWVGDKDSVLQPLIEGAHKYVDGMLGWVKAQDYPGEYDNFSSLVRVARRSDPFYLLEGLAETLARLKSLGDEE